jgi:hypothetical protein
LLKAVVTRVPRSLFHKKHYTEYQQIENFAETRFSGLKNSMFPDAGSFKNAVIPGKIKKHAPVKPFLVKTGNGMNIF